MWCIPPKRSAEFVCHLEDVLDVYCRPADPRRPVVCLDELSTQLVGEVRMPLPFRPGQIARYDCEYVRHGTATLFMAFEPLGGWREVQVTERRQRGDWAHFVRDLVDGRYKDADQIVLVNNGRRAVRSTVSWRCGAPCSGTSRSSRTTRWPRAATPATSVPRVPGTAACCSSTTT